MAGIGDITITQISRPCLVWSPMWRGEERGAIFRLWGQHSESNVITSPVAVVEYRDGTVEMIPVGQVRFLDTDEWHYPDDRKEEEKKV
jgi:hypothetical protein